MSYADDTEYASRNLIELVGHEEGLLAELNATLRAQEVKYRVNKWDYETSDLNEDFSDAHVQAAFHRKAKAHQEAKKLKGEVEALQTSIGAKQLAVQAICGALLQIAKQGISLVHGSLAAASPGRDVAGAPLKEIIWQGRNQALHYEDGAFSSSVVTLFGILEKARGSEFALTRYPHRSRAKQVVYLLGWTDHKAFDTDLRSLGL